MIKMFSKKEVALGKGSVTQYTLFECKWLFSIIFYKWNTVDQIRFHTHAFAAVAFLLRGWYEEKVITYNDVGLQFTTQKTVNQWLKPRYLPRNYCHSIGYALPSTITMVLCGPWQKTWKEFFPDSKKWVTYTWGRKVIK